MDENGVVTSYLQFSYLFVVFDTIQDGEDGKLSSHAYVNGIDAFEFEATGFEMSFALSQEHIDFLDMFGEAGWEMVSHHILSANVHLSSVSFPQIKHFMAFKRPYGEYETAEERSLREAFLRRGGKDRHEEPPHTGTGPS